MPEQAALDSCVCVRETEAVIVKHQLIVQLLLKDVREREGGGGKKKNQEERNQSAQKKQKGQVPTPVQKTTERTQSLK